MDNRCTNVFANQRSKYYQNVLKGLLGVIGCLYVLQHSSAVIAGNSGRVGGTDGNGFGTVLCPKSDQRIMGLTAATAKKSGKNYIRGVKALCKTMDGSGNWAEGSAHTKYQKGIFSFPNTTEVSAGCPDNTWVAGISGATAKYYNFMVLSRVAIRCYASTSAGKRTGDARYVEVYDGGGGTRRDKYCPGDEIARGFYGRHGDFLDSVGLNCVERRAQPAPENTFSWTKGFTNAEVRSFFGGRFRLRTILGKDMRNVLAGSTVVRTDGNSCKFCHSSGNYSATFTATTTRNQACEQLGNNQFQIANKPDYLKRLINDWLQRGCP